MNIIKKDSLQNKTKENSNIEKKYKIALASLKKNKIAFKRLLMNYILLKKRYTYLIKNSNSQVKKIIEKLSMDKFQLLIDQHRKIIKISDDLLKEIEMTKEEFQDSFYIDILFEKYLPLNTEEGVEIKIDDIIFPIMIKNFKIEEDHIHPYLYFKITGVLHYNKQINRFIYQLNFENCSANVELAYFQKTDSLITTLSVTNFNLMRAKKTIEMHKQMLISLTCSLVEEYNHETSIHLQRIREITTYISTECKRLNYIEIENYDLEEYIKDINYTSVLHDIGKMAIPKDILSKNTKLTDDELRVIKNHTIIGSEYIRKIMNSFSTMHGFISYIDFLQIPYQICLYHHEKWNGTGYPSKLAGNDIPIPARIVSVADTYDAIRATRSYDKNRPHSEAVDIIRSESGKQFDPKVVEAFLNVESFLKNINYDE